MIITVKNTITLVVSADTLVSTETFELCGTAVIYYKRKNIVIEFTELDCTQFFYMWPVPLDTVISLGYRKCTDLGIYRKQRKEIPAPGNQPADQRAY